MSKAIPRRWILVAGAAAAGLGIGGFMLTASSPAQAEVTVHKSPSCGCCGAWVRHLEASGFSVATRNLDDLTPLKRRLGVPADLESCHTAEIGGYVVEGHVPAGDIRRLIATRPSGRGLAVPGMPIGSPGMEDGNRRDRYDVILFDDAGGRSTFARY